MAGNMIRTRGSAIVALTCLAMIGAACSGGGSSNANSPAGQGPTGGASDTAVQTYGYGPEPAPGVTYQPDVVMVPAGPAAIRSATTDGLVWTLDRAAKGVGDLKVGSVLLATGRAAGRVVRLRDEGDSRIVTLAPIELTDIVRDGEINLKQALNAGAMTYQEVPDQPGARSVPDDQDLKGGQATTSAARFTAVARRAEVCACGPSSGKLPPASKGSVAIPAGPYTITPGYKAGELSLDVDREGALKIGVHFAFPVSNLSIDSGASIKGGLIAGSRFVISGIKGIDVSLSAGAAGGEADNEKIKVEVPVKVSIPVPPSPATAGLPLEITIEFTYSIETAITGQNSTLVASGSYGLDGPIGVSGGSVLTPKFTVIHSIIDSLTGITLGPSGVVFAVKMKVQAGLGIPEANAGPFASVTTALGVTNGSSLGAPLARCKGATLDMNVGAGVSLSISTPLLDALKKLLPPGIAIPDSKDLLDTNVLHRTQVVPDVPLCQGGGGSSSSSGGSAAG